MKHATRKIRPILPVVEPPAEAVTEALGSVIQSPEIGRIVEVTIAEINAAKQAELERAARVANGD